MSNSDSDIPSLHTTKITKRILLESPLEKALNESARDLLPGRKPTVRDILLLSEAICKENISKNRWRTIGGQEKVKVIRDKLINHFHTQDQTGLIILKNKNISMRIKRLLDPFICFNNAKLTKKQREILMPAFLDSDFIFYEEVQVRVEPESEEM